MAPGSKRPPGSQLSRWVTKTRAPRSHSARTSTPASSRARSSRRPLVPCPTKRQRSAAARPALKKGISAAVCSAALSIDQTEMVALPQAGDPTLEFTVHKTVLPRRERGLFGPLESLYKPAESLPFVLVAALRIAPAFS